MCAPKLDILHAEPTSNNRSFDALRGFLRRHLVPDTRGGIAKRPCSAPVVVGHQRLAAKQRCNPSVTRAATRRSLEHGLLGAVTLGALKVVRHLQAGPPKAALDIEALVVLAAVEYCLVAPRLLGNVVERLNEAQAQLFALLVFGDGDVLNVADGPEVVDAGVRGARVSLLCQTEEAERFPYNLRSASSAPVPTILDGQVLVSSMTMTK